MNSASSTRRVTLADLAREAGVSIATVSRALRKDKRQSRSTCLRIQALARRRGYRPDPAMSALVAYRRRIRPHRALEKIACLVDFEGPEAKYPEQLKLALAGLRGRALELGYSTDLFLIPRDPREQRRLSRILHARGIRGVVFTPIRHPATHFSWHSFTAVSIGKNLDRLAVNNVTYDSDLCVSSAYRKLREHGYKNIGFCNIAASESRNRHLFVASYLKCLFLDGLPMDPARVLLYDDAASWSPLPWLATHRFDAVISCVPGQLIEKLRGSRYRVPRDLGVIAYNLPSSETDFSTWTADSHRLGAAAIDLLHLQMLDRQLGLPRTEDHSSTTLTPSWHQGATIRRLAKKPSNLPEY